jgi:hypothetical protein
MRLGRTKGISIAGVVTFDGWDVLLGGGFAALILGATLDDVAFLLPVGVVLLLLWLVATALVNLGVIRKSGAAGTSGSASASDDGV